MDFGPATRGLVVPFRFFLFSCFSHFYFCCLHPFLIKILSKIPENFTICFLMIFNCFMAISYFEVDKKHVRSFLFDLRVFDTFLRIFLRYNGSNFCSMELILDM